MGRVIKYGAAASDQIRDIELTRYNAAARGRRFSTDADRFLAPYHERAKELAEKIRLNQEAVDRARAEQAMASGRCDERVAAVRDDLFNLIGRRIRDRRFQMMFPGGTSSYTDVGPTSKVFAVQLLAGLILEVNHPLVARDLAEEFAEELRTAAAELARINDTFAPLRLEQRTLGLAYTANARLANLQLHQLKKFWSAEGLTDEDIHVIIPHRPLRSGVTEPTEPSGKDASSEADEGTAASEEPDVEAPAAAEVG